MARWRNDKYSILRCLVIIKRLTLVDSKQLFKKWSFKRGVTHFCREVNIYKFIYSPFGCIKLMLNFNWDKSFFFIKKRKEKKKKKPTNPNLLLFYSLPFSLPNRYIKLLLFFSFKFFQINYIKCFACNCTIDLSSLLLSIFICCQKLVGPHFCSPSTPMPFP